MNTPLIIAHRGYSALAPENTLAAFRMAIEAGADGIEFDVQLSRDGVPVVFHDYDLRRVADRKRRIIEMTAAEIGEIDVGAWFNRRNKRKARAEFAGEPVPTLKSTLDSLARFTGKIYIELKAGESDGHDLAAAVCDELKDSPLLSQVIVKSFRLAAIPEVRTLLPGVQTAALIAPEILDYLRRKRHIITIASEFGAHQLSIHRSLATPRFTWLAAQAGMPVTVWTADNPKWVERARKRSVGAIITNDPSKMLAARDAALETFDRANDR